MEKESKAVLLGYVGGTVSKATLDPSKRSTLRFERPTGERGILYHKTVVVLHNPDGSIVLNSGGWRTPTTKERINSELPSGYAVSQSKGLWYVHGPQSKVPYYDGIVIVPGADLKVSKWGEIEERKQKKLGKQILAFVKKLDKLSEIPQPSQADCWYCSMVTDDGKTLGESTNDNHLLSHVVEGYLHGSLIVNALRWSGLSDQGIALHYRMNLKDRVKNTLRRYLREKLGLTR